MRRELVSAIFGDSRTKLKLVEAHTDPEVKIVADSRFVSSGYFAAMAIPVLIGKGCHDSANYLDGVIVNRSFENSYLGGLPTIGRHLQVVSSQFILAPSEIRGVVGDACESGINHAPRPTVDWRQAAPTPTPYFLIQTQAEPMSMAETLRREIHPIEPARSVFEISSLDEHLSDSFAESRLLTILVTMFALTAVSLRTATK